MGGYGVKPVGLDDDFSPPAAKTPLGGTRRTGETFAWVVAALYLPFCWIVLVGPALDRFPWAARLLLWLILPGFLPSAYLFHPHDTWMWASSAALTLGLLVGLTWLGTRGRWQFWLALALALLVAAPTSVLGYVLIVLN